MELGMKMRGLVEVCFRTYSWFGRREKKEGMDWVKDFKFFKTLKIFFLYRGLERENP